MAEVTRRRLGELQRAVFSVLLDKADGLPAQEVLRRAEAICPATEFENEDYPKRPGVRRYPKTIRFATIPSVKAGWLIKDGGVWRLTDEGRAAYARYTEPGDFQRIAVAEYRVWKADNEAPVVYDAGEKAEDAEAVELERMGVPTRRAWLVRGANVDGANVLPLWFAEGFCSISFHELPEISRGTPKMEIAKQARDAFAGSSAIAQGLYVGGVHRFVNEMDVGDLVVTVDRSKVYVGVITGDPVYVAEVPSTMRRRSVDWANVETPFNRSELTSDAADGLRGQLTVTELSQFLAEFARLGGVELDVIEEVSPTVREIELPAPDEVLADRLLLPVEWLRETVDLLNDKRQIILYGPPGTGKTFLAQELCKALVEPSGGEYAIVQFHPSYSYEDFFEGLRPRLAQDGSGSVAFDLVPGPLKRMALLAQKNPTHPYVLIIDEINRANLAKVFGELYFLLEYRGQRVTLQYSDEEFLLPRNLFLIGTMNTADRSIALVDAAMRRRFYFQCLFPGEEPIRDVLPRWLTVHGFKPEAAELLNALNESINDPDFAIGPSYLMTRRIADPGGLERIWKTTILPLLTEHYFGEGRDINREFGLPTLRKMLNGRSVPASQIDADKSVRAEMPD
jgi:5-methylcytosine-specific restriction enzyme B